MIDRAVPLHGRRQPPARLIIKEKSALLLLVLGVLTDDHHIAFAFDDLALFAHGLN